MTVTNIYPSFMLSQWHKRLPVIAINGHSMKPLNFFIPIFTTAIHYILFFHRIYMTALVYVILVTLANLYSSIQDTPPPPFSFWSSNGICGKSPYVSNIAGPLCSPSIIFSPYLLLHSLEPEVEVTRTVTQPQSDKMHNRRCCRELGSSGEAAQKKQKTEVHRIES